MVHRDDQRTAGDGWTLGARASGKLRPATEPRLCATHPIPGLLSSSRRDLGLAGRVNPSVPSPREMRARRDFHAAQGISRIYAEEPDQANRDAGSFNFAFLGAPGVVVLKDGALMTCLTYQGLTSTRHSPGDLGAQTPHQPILSHYGDGFMINTDLIRHPSIDYPTGGAFPARRRALIDREREMHYMAEGKHLETSFALSLHLPATVRLSIAAREAIFLKP